MLTACGCGTARRLNPDFANELADFAVGAGVHSQRTADRAGNAGERADAGRPGGSRLGGHERHVGRASSFDDHAAIGGAHARRRELAGKRTTIPRTPPSPTSTLLPLPMIHHAIRRRKQ